MHKLLVDSPGEKLLLLGNEAIARGALEAGVAFATCYPGTPSSEIPLQFFKITKEVDDLYFEYSTNEKVALEVAAGAAVAGVRTICTMKHVGLNVAADPLMTLAYTGVNAGMVIITADDPSLFSSQNEQDNRYFARLSGLPMIEPTNVQEMKDLTVYAFELSEQMKLPVLLRTTTRLNHIRGAVTLGNLRPRVSKAVFKKEPFSYVCVPAVSRALHLKLMEKFDRLCEISNASEFNPVIGRGSWGIATSGASFNYVNDAVNDLGIQDKVRILKLMLSYPVPQTKVLNFLKGVEKVLVVEELEPILETELKVVAQENGITIPIKGKSPELFSRAYEYDPGLVRKKIAAYFGLPDKTPAPVDLSNVPTLPARPPNLCPGCPHRATYYAVKQVAGDEAIYPTDIGCYTLGLLPPISAADFVICMGSSVSSSAGFSRTQDKKVISFIGDSTFFHSGITGLVNGVHNNHNFTLVILDNGTTAMTGHQPHPGVDSEAMGFKATQLSVESVVRGLGVEKVVVVNPMKVKKTIEAVKDAVAFQGVSVIISKEICPLFARQVGQAKKAKPFVVNQEKCKKHRICINQVACPAFYLEGDQVMINKNQCIGCAVCAQVCPENAIVPSKD
ncbi:MAG: indolepyruvate ferredoxin oxidoreductase subunit alpha [Deltaproteobacteria bacterium]|nr:indolepyruvate ferredoxin oxidoreductase subunit alpha [Deltaproteobacteria bacterium]